MCSNDNYPTDLVKAYLMMSEYKHWMPKNTIPDVNAVTFVQNEKNKKKDDVPDWHKDATCHECSKRVIFVQTVPM